LDYVEEDNDAEEVEAMKGLKEIKSRFEFSLDNRQVVLIISGVILVLMLSFVMGTLFGKNLGAVAAADKAKVAANDETAAEPDKEDPAEDSPAGSTDQAATPEKAAAPETDVSAPVRENTPEKREAFIRELESMKLDGVKAGGDEMPTKVETPTFANLNPDRPEPPVLKKEEPEKIKPSAPAAVKPDEKKKNAKEADAKTKASVDPKTSSAYTLQLASIPSRGEADQMLRELRGRSYDAYMLEVTLPDKGTFYRVRVGHYDNLDQAKKALGIIQSREGKFFDAWVTQ
jgi:DedD protein